MAPIVTSWRNPRNVKEFGIRHAQPDHTVDDCIRIVTIKRIRHLPVVQGEKVIGVVSIGDLVQTVISTQDETSQYLQEYIVGRSSG
jgi:CBS domain-containing protein